MVGNQELIGVLSRLISAKLFARVPRQMRKSITIENREGYGKLWHDGLMWEHLARFGYAVAFGCHPHAEVLGDWHCRRRGVLANNTLPAGKLAHWRLRTFKEARSKSQ